MTAAQVDAIVTTVLAALPLVDEGEVVATVEAIQDEVERALMAAGAFAVARRYILYREARARRREEQALRLRDADGQEVLLNLALLRSWIAEACAGYEDRVSAKAIAEEVLAGLPAGAPLADLERSIVLAARTRIERDPAYSFVAARALLRGLYAEALGRRVGIDETRAALSPRLRRLRPARGRAGAAGARDARLRPGAAGRGARPGARSRLPVPRSCKPSTTAT